MVVNGFLVGLLGECLLVGGLVGVGVVGLPWGFLKSDGWFAWGRDDGYVDWVREQLNGDEVSKGLANIERDGDEGSKVVVVRGVDSDVLPLEP